MAVMSGATPASDRVFTLTICACRKQGMGEDADHRYLSEKHAPLLTDLMVENKIIGYTMVRICCRHSYKEDLNIDLTKQHGKFLRGCPRAESLTMTPSFILFSKMSRTSSTSRMTHITNKWLCPTTRTSRIMKGRPWSLAGLRRILLKAKL